jgi:hypothetical protein
MTKWVDPAPAPHRDASNARFELALVEWMRTHHCFGCGMPFKDDEPRLHINKANYHGFKCIPRFSADEAVAIKAGHVVVC